MCGRWRGWVPGCGRDDCTFAHPMNRAPGFPGSTSSDSHTPAAAEGTTAGGGAAGAGAGGGTGGASNSGGGGGGGEEGTQRTRRRRRKHGNKSKQAAADAHATMPTTVPRLQGGRSSGSMPSYDSKAGSVDTAPLLPYPYASPALHRQSTSNTSRGSTGSGFAPMPPPEEAGPRLGPHSSTSTDGSRRSSDHSGSGPAGTVPAVSSGEHGHQFALTPAQAQHQQHAQQQQQWAATVGYHPGYHQLHGATHRGAQQSAPPLPAQPPPAFSTSAAATAPPPPPPPLAGLDGSQQQQQQQGHLQHAGYAQLHAPYPAELQHPYSATVPAPPAGGVHHHAQLVYAHPHVHPHVHAPPQPQPQPHVMAPHVATPEAAAALVRMRRAVRVYWDVENCPVTRKAKGTEVVSTLREVLSSMGLLSHPMAPLDIRAYYNARAPKVWS